MIKIGDKARTDAAYYEVYMDRSKYRSNGKLKIKVDQKDQGVDIYLIGGTGGEGGEGKVGPGREGLMALASAGCEMSSSSYTAGPHAQLPGLCIWSCGCESRV